MLEDHDLQHLLGFGVGKPTLSDEAGDGLGQSMYSCWTAKDCCLMLEISSYLWTKKCSSDFMVVTIASRAALSFVISSRQYGPVVYKGQESLSIFALKHELELLPIHYGCHQLGQARCLGHPGGQEPWCRRFSSPQTVVGELKWNVGASQQLWG